MSSTVIVGAGSAGCVIATRMTESESHDVELVEAGVDHPDADALPSDLRNGRRNSLGPHDWNYRHKVNAKQITFLFPRGRVVGGSSAVNTCIALRGHPADYDEWAARGLPEWTWDKCLPAFKRLETDLDHKNDFHGDTGPIPIRRHRVSELTRWQSAFLEACDRMGFRPFTDINDPTQPTGFGAHAMNKIDGERMSVARCYLKPEVRKRRNLRITPNTTVHRVILVRGRVAGLEVEQHGRRRVIETSRVVLSAGAIATPGILLRSGIGPRETLSRLNVACEVELPSVGARVLDHCGAAFFLWPREGVCNVEDPLIQTVLRYTSEQSGMRGDMQLQPGSNVPLPSGMLPLVSMMCSVGKTKGTGTLEFRSTNPHQRPMIHSHILEHPEDLARAAEALDIAYLLATSSPMRDLATFLLPSGDVLHRRSSIAEWVWQSCDSGYHPSGTVPMGSDDDRDSAVDQYGRVRGVEGLFVADASIMPTIPSANTNLATIMIGERFGAWLRDGHI